MIDNQMMDYYIQPWHIYSHSRKSTRRGLCRTPFSLVEFHICFLLDCASIHEISSLVIFIPDSSIYQISSSTMEIFIHYILYVAMTTHDILYTIPIHGHCTLMYLGLLYVFVVTCRDWLFYCTDEWLVLPPGSSLIHLWDGFYNVFRPSCYPSDLTH